MRNSSRYVKQRKGVFVVKARTGRSQVRYRREEVIAFRFGGANYPAFGRKQVRVCRGRSKSKVSCRTSTSKTGAKSHLDWV